MPPIRLGYLEPFRPFCWAGDGGVQGLFVDALGARLRCAVEWVPGTLAGLPLWLAEGRIDGIAAKAITPDRAGAFRFSGPLVQTAAALFGPPGHPAPHPGAAGRAVIATPGNGPLAALLPRLAPEARVLPVADYPAALAAVESGAAGWAALNADAVAALFPGRTGPAGPRFAPLGLAVAVMAGDPAGVLGQLGLTSSAAGTERSPETPAGSPAAPDRR